MPFIDPAIENYVKDHSEPEPALLREIARFTYSQVEMPQMLTGHIEGRFLKLLAGLLNAREILEIGTFTGYSALCLAEALPADGFLLTLELDPVNAKIARSHFAKSPHGKKIKLLEGPALDSLKRIQGPADMVFIDADKENYPHYYEACLPLLKPGGLIAIDNVLWGGAVLNPTDPTDRAIHHLNEIVARDERVDRVMLTVRDGLLLVRKRS